jgi:acetate---CoA ligase (ADP-forming)
VPTSAEAKGSTSVSPREYVDGSAKVARLLRPTSIAVIGASDRSRWSQTIVENLRSHGYRGTLSLVNPKGVPVHGQASVKRCSELEEVDLGIVLVPQLAVPGVIDDLADAGASAAMILTSGFAETGPEGAALQDEIVTRARTRGLSLLGPNSLGFIDYLSGVVAWATPVKPPSGRSGVAILSQSGATALFLSQLAHQQDIGLSHVVATGNEADLDGTAFLDYLIDVPETRAVAMFIETVRDPAAFRASAARALAKGKPMVVLKVGRSEVTARSAEAHTGALVGDDNAFDGICRRYGIIRVSSVEELLVTADIAATCGVLRPGGLAFLSNSGGICEIGADRAEELGLTLPELSETTLASLRDLLPGYGTPHNPLDLTGGIDPADCEEIVRMLGAQEDVAAVLCPYYPVPNTPDEVSERLSALHDGLARGLKAIPVPGLLVSYTCTHVSDHARAIVAASDLPYRACGLDLAMAGLAALARWSDRYRAVSGPEDVGEAQHIGARPRSEVDALAYLSSQGVPVVPWTLARTAAEAAEATDGVAGKVVVKIASADILHKSDIGGVVLNVEGGSAAAAAFAKVTGAARKHYPDARVDGALVVPMRDRGLELLVGVTRDPQWGPMLALGLGGIFVEILKDVSMRPLPVDAAEVGRMLSELRGAGMLDGARGVPAADRDAIAAAVVAIGRAAVAAGPDMSVLEVNPLWVNGAQVEALDALMEWTDRPPEREERNR